MFLRWRSLPRYVVISGLCGRSRLSVPESLEMRTSRHGANEALWRAGLAPKSVFLFSASSSTQDRQSPVSTWSLRALRGPGSFDTACCSIPGQFPRSCPQVAGRATAAAARRARGAVACHVLRQALRAPPKPRPPPEQAKKSSDLCLCSKNSAWGAQPAAMASTPILSNPFFPPGRMF